MITNVGCSLAVCVASVSRLYDVAFTLLVVVFFLSGARNCTAAAAAAVACLDD